MLPGFGAPGCHPSTLIEFVNTALAIRDSVKPRCHGGVTGPMNFRKPGLFFRKSVLPEFFGHGLPSRHFD